MVTPTKAPVHEYGIVAGRALVDGQAETVIVPVLNPTDSTIFLPKHFKIAIMAPVASTDGGSLADQGARISQPLDEEEPHQSASPHPETAEAAAPAQATTVTAAAAAH